MNPKQARAVEELARGASVREAAAVVGVSRVTLHRWLALPDVAEALADVQAEARQRAVRKLSSALAAAAARVVDLAENAADEAVQLRAALAVPQMLRDVLDLEHATAVQAEGVRVEYVNDWRAGYVFDHGDAVAAIAAAAEAVDGEVLEAGRDG